MVNAEPVPEDGNLPAAKHRLENAISALIDPKPETRTTDDGKTRIEWLDSLYRELQEACPGDQGHGHGTARSVIPFWVDAVDLLHEIDTAVTAWEPPYPIQPGDLTHPAYPTVLRLQTIEHRAWRPKDVHGMDQISGIIESWCASIKALLTPIPNWTLPAPCPACGTKVVYRKDSAGELVRHPALTIGTLGCECLKCHAAWGPERFVFLARVLGSLPENVLE